jgi:serine/threonine-protein kinase
MLGRTISHYRILEELSGGGMGVIYRAEDTRLQRTVALKFLPAEWCRDAAARQRLMREARAASRLDHPNICTIHAVGETEDGQIFIVMPYYPGATVKARIGQGPLPVADALGIGMQVLEGLSRAHQRGIIHRDIKPANLIVTADGVIKILDFGLAKLAGPVETTTPRSKGKPHDLSEEITRTGGLMGTPGYMSPEQVLKEELDHRTDVWSVGVCIYELLAGRRPFQGDDPQAVLSAILHEQPEPVGAQRSDVPPELDQLLRRAMAKSPDARYQEAHEMLRDLQYLQHHLDPFAAPPPPTPTGPSIAVMPFANMSTAPGQEFFCDGMAEEIINALTQVEGLRVVARTSTFGFKGRNFDLRQVGRRLNVGAILEGSVRKVAHRLRVTAELIDVTNGVQLWSERFDRDIEDVFTVQDEISQAIVDTLRIKLVGEPQAGLVRRHTENLEAYALYLKGRFFWNKRTEESLQRGIELFEQAIEKDLDYALAYAGLADSYIILGYYGALPPQRTFPLAKSAAQRALMLDDTLAEASTSLAFATLLYDWDWSVAESGFQRALSLNPDYATARHWHAEFLAFRGRIDEALEESRRALANDPLSPILNVLLGWTQYYARRYEEAIQTLGQTLELDPDLVPAHLWLGLALARRSMHDEAIETLERAVELSERSPLPLAMLAQTRAAAGQVAEARQLLGELRRISEKIYVPPYHIAASHVASGEAGPAMDYLQRAVERRDMWCLFVAIDPVWDEIRAAPRFTELTRQIGL